ncbi:Polyribonucleotide nucleotidyltransferase [Dirofilaria immitis]
MLGKLVNKFKKHSLQEEITSSTGSVGSVANNASPGNNKITTVTPTGTIVTPLPQQLNRRSARISALYEDNNALVMIDSGTESDDDELEQLDSNLYRASSRDIMGSSPPNLTSSPPLASEFETDSWDSTGCESGIVLHDRSEISELSQDNILDEVMKGTNCIPTTTTATATAATATATATMSLMNAGKINEGIVSTNRCSNVDSGKTETGAFRPVTRRRYVQNESNQDSGNIIDKNIAFDLMLTNHHQQQQQPVTYGIIGEKRRYESIASKFRFDRETKSPSSPITMRLRSYNNSSNGDSSRETLVAARRQPVKVIIHNPSVRRSSLASTTTSYHYHQQSNKTDFINELDALPTHPLKRGRMISSGRPSLDFEKMRERLVVSNVCGIGSQEFVDSAMGNNDKDIEKRKQDWALTTSTSGGRRCPQHQQVRCQQADCTFRPVDYDGTQTGGGGNSSNNGDQ